MKNIELPFVRDMFNAIAPRYDLLNRLLSLRQDVYWRRKMISRIKIPEQATILDMACGTGDVILEIIRQKGTGNMVIGSDFSSAMLQLADKKIKSEASASQIFLVAGNALRMPFKPESFDSVTIAFGIRNINDKLSALKAFHYGLKKDGMLAVLELTTPQKRFFRSLYLFYFRKILPMIGRLVSGKIKAYQYLPDSVLNFPSSRDFADIMLSAGFSNVKWQKLTFGIATLYTGKK
ncbi:MAG: bifunctional demethylmenaquinone methyltransferase/2-methoxy-6-polyprenyl-1,4-benzoquinol methylase UbiE [Deltaproteobacteria bacterium]|nr:bifunctional demethylmenaquinone methyltransferase/2-methoxy-6-polyprenyl-1,4-benzoquinol methylase UbiE [Deltaproteobacteria bacterium]